jgi:hypothetical protein
MSSVAAIRCCSIEMRKASALAQIAALEAAQHRTVREILCKVAPNEAARLAEIDAEIVRLREDLRDLR